MSFRFKKSLKILPGIRLNISKNGLNSVTIGKPGASVNISKKGKQATVGIPGTGLSYSQKLPSRTDTRSRSPSTPSTPSTPSSVEPNSKQTISPTKIIVIGLLVIFAFLIGAVFF
ncbi:DUF4236 domain-containing protein [Acinetobacter sp. YH12120]|uniref:DUF4236 domain-containing protein n=1 Tax=Acinetobacter sp. YH12120 TaxID=2601107 RepID=UPI0015D21238|nr:DUF4236 domain-containing protein [Acinetobacter sp. YH12120]